jgi:DNA-binding transcriptional ArsR family regulator
MIGVSEIAELGALVGDPARAAMLVALMAGRPLSAGELAYFANVSPQTASSHLGKLAQSRLVAIEARGRHRYYRLAGPSVAETVEAIMRLAAQLPPRHRPSSPRDERLRVARSCYDHLAGRLGVALTEALVRERYLQPAPRAFRLTPEGKAFLAGLGFDLGELRAARRALARPCLDWSERRPHLAGALGAALARHCLERGWLERARGERSLTITPAGRRGFREQFRLDIDPLLAHSRPSRATPTG